MKETRCHSSKVVVGSVITTLIMRPPARVLVSNADVVKQWPLLRTMHTEHNNHSDHAVGRQKKYRWADKGIRVTLG